MFLKLGWIFLSIWAVLEQVYFVSAATTQENDENVGDWYGIVAVLVAKGPYYHFYADDSHVLVSLNTPDRLSPCTFSSTIFNCKGKKLTRIPTDIPRNTTKLNIDHNIISVIEPGAFQDLIALTDLNIDHNIISVIEPGAFQDLIALTELDIGNNNISLIKPGAFQDLIALTSLDLSFNSIEKVTYASLKGLSKLLELDIRNNTISVIESGAFQDLAALEYLDLSFNSIDKVTYASLKGLSKLDILLIHDNNIAVIEPGAFQDLTALTGLNIDNNIISVIDSGAFQGLTALRGLSINHNSISVIVPGAFQDLAALIQLLINNNSISVIEPGVFQNLAALTKLYLGFNVIEAVTNASLKGLSKLQQLLMSNNNISVIESGGFQDLTALTHMNLDHNNIYKLHTGMFARMKSLKVLSLSYNKITVLVNGTFGGLSKLGHLFLDNNSISAIEPDVFKDLDSLTYMFLTKNKITVLEDGTWIGLLKLKLLLYHRGNRLTLLSPNSDHVRSLDYNNLKVLQNGTFRGMPDLQYLFINDNNIAHISSRALYGLSGLKLIMLSNNDIKVLEDEAFLIVNKSLETVYLMNTKMEKINAAAFCHLKGVEIYIDVIQELRKIQAKGMLYAALTASGFAEGKDGTERWPCPVGKYVKPMGTISYKAALYMNCDECPAGGYFSDSVAYVAKECKRCNDGTYVKPVNAPGKSRKDCEVCPPGTQTDKHAGYRACKCLDDFHRRGRFKRCETCPDTGLKCSNGSVYVKPDFYWYWEDIQNFKQYEDFVKDLNITGDEYNKSLLYFNATFPRTYPCPRKGTCLGGLNMENCDTGYIGKLCTNCSRGYYKGASNCIECPNNTIVFVEIIIIVCLVGFVVALIIWSGKKEKENHKTDRRLIDIFLSRLKILIGFYQVTTGILSSFTSINWPAGLSEVGNFAKNIQLGVQQVAPLYCLYSPLALDPYRSMIAFMVTNATVVFIAVVFYFLRKLILKRRKDPENNDNDMEKTLSQTKVFLYRNVFLFLFTTYPSTCSAIVRILPFACRPLCSEKGCHKYLKVDLNVKCEEYTIISCIFLFYIALLPGVAFIILKKYRNKSGVDVKRDAEKESNQHPCKGRSSEVMCINDVKFTVDIEVAEPWKPTKLIYSEYEEAVNKTPEVITGMSFLYENYKDDVWYWELVEILRKLILTSGILLFGKGDHSYIGLASIVSGLFLAWYAHRNPVQDSFEALLMLSSLVITFLDLGIGVMLTISQETESYDGNTFLEGRPADFIVTGLNVIIIVIIGVKYLAIVIHNFVVWRRNPVWSISCCLAMLLPVTEASGKFKGIAKKGLMQNLELGCIDVPSVTNEIEGREIISLKINESERNGKVPQMFEALKIFRRKKKHTETKDEYELVELRE